MELQVDTTRELSRVEQLGREARMYRESIEMNMYQLARVFVEAKELVPHGEWEKWLSDNADVSVRTAQDMMAAYKRFGERPMFDGLGKSKLFKLLALPDGEEERFLTEHDVEAMSSREVEKAVKAARAEAEKEIEQERQRRLDAERRAEEAENAPPVIPEEFVRELRESKEAADRATEEANRLAEASNEILDQRNRLSQENALLRKEAQEREEIISEQQSEYNRVRDELLNIKSSAAKGDAERNVSGRLTLETLTNAVRQFIGTCATLPQMRDSLINMSGEEKREAETLIETVEKWVKDSKTALNMYAVSEVNTL